MYKIKSQIIKIFLPIRSPALRLLEGQKSEANEITVCMYVATFYLEIFNFQMGEGKN